MAKMNATAVFLVLSVAPVFGQASQAPTQTTPVAGARFEIVQSSLAARDTFKLDRFRGEVYWLMGDHDGRPFWALTTWRDKPEIGLAATGPRFQLFLGGQRGMDTFLMDSTTGKTWVWAIVGDASAMNPNIFDLAWVPMRDAAVTKAANPPGFLPDPPSVVPKKPAK
jgi:hypothetical protein